MSNTPVPYLAEDDVYLEVEDPGFAPYGLFLRLGAEAFGTFMVVFGILATIVFSAFNNFQMLAVALTAGALLMAAFATFAHVSGGHFNPAVTLAAVITGRTPWRDLLPYWVAQVAGACLAAVLTWAVIPADFAPMVQLADSRAMMERAANGWADLSQTASMTGGGAETTFVSALLLEVIGTAILVAVFIGITSRVRRVATAAPAYGFTLAALILVTWGFTNTGLNPARSFAAVLFANGQYWQQLWLFVVAPLLGAALAALTYQAVRPLDAPNAYVMVTDGYDDEDEEDAAVDGWVRDNEALAAAEAEVADKDYSADEVWSDVKDAAAKADEKFSADAESVVDAAADAVDGADK